MGGKAKSVYFSVVELGSHKTILRKVFFDAKACNEFMNNPELRVTYPEDKFYFLKETY